MPRLRKDGQPWGIRKPISTVPDPTDPGTRRPDDPPTQTNGTHFESRPFPQFHSKINLPHNIDNKDPFLLFSQFLSPEILQLMSIVRMRTRQITWFPLSIKELYLIRDKPAGEGF
jgi:hypothetical protein